MFYGKTDSLEDAETLLLEPGDSFHSVERLDIKWLQQADAELFEFSTQHFDEDSYIELYLEILFNSFKFNHPILSLAQVYS